MRSPWTPWSLHIRTMLRALERLEAARLLFWRPHGSPSWRRQSGRLSAIELPDCSTFATDRKPLEHAYYSGGLRYQIWVTAPDGGEVPLIDGGAFDWLTRLASNRRAVFIATGAGAQLIVSRFRKDARGCPC